MFGSCRSWKGRRVWRWRVWRNLRVWHCHFLNVDVHSRAETLNDHPCFMVPRPTLNVTVYSLPVCIYTHTHTHTRWFSSALFSISSMRVNLWMCSSALLFVSSPLLLLFFSLSSLHPLGLRMACFPASQHWRGKLRGELSARPDGWSGTERCLLNSPHVPAPGI